MEKNVKKATTYFVLSSLIIHTLKNLNKFESLDTGELLNKILINTKATIGE